jgi:anhydro-N-acetylmuramic acid kinase
MPTSERYIGLMSGTSMDAVDAVAADFSRQPPGLLGATSTPIPAPLRDRLLRLNTTGPDELDETGIGPADFAAIGCHGQTVRHRPHRGFSIQIGNPAALAHATGIAVVADFRSADLAAGGQGAPLVAAFHRAVFQHPTRHRAIINVGGISNITDLPPSDTLGGWVGGFDCGPGNLLSDAWIQRHEGRPFDDGGTWAASGQVQPDLLAALLSHPFFRQSPPKSTGRDDFNLAWLDQVLAGRDLDAADVQATLIRVTAQSISDALKRHARGVEEVYLCGGGAANLTLRRTVAGLLAGTVVATTAELGIDPQHVEGWAFAWLARQRLLGAPGNIPSVTGAREWKVLGAVYAA